MRIAETVLAFTALALVLPSLPLLFLAMRRERRPSRVLRPHPVPS